jgi:site-specific DNA-methyltransferase (adenine-specific)
MTYKIKQGNCLELMPKIPTGSVDMILCDLPYGTTACKWDTIIPFEPLWAEYKRVIKPNGAIVLFGSQPFTSALVMSNIKMFKYQWIWDKVRGSNFATVNIRPFNSHEDICVFYGTQTTYNAQKFEGKPYTQKQGYVGEAKQTGLHKKEVVTINSGDRHPLSILTFSKQSGQHPTQKPVALCEYLIKTYTNEGE